MPSKKVSPLLTQNAKNSSTQAMLVKDIMRTKPRTMTPETYMYEAMAYMTRHGLNYLPIVDREQLVGVITPRDLLRYRSQKALLLLGNIKEAFQERDINKFDQIAKMDDQVEILHAEITEYLRKLTAQNLTEQENDDLLRYLRVNETIERIGDVIESNLADVGQEAIRDGITKNETAREILSSLYEKIRHALGAVHAAVVEQDEIAAQDILHMKDDIKQLVIRALQVQSQRLQTEGADNIDITKFENELIDSMKRIYSLTKRIAKLTLPLAVVE